MLLAGGRSGPSSARLRIPRAVTPAGGRGTNQVPSSNPLEKWDFQFILPKSDKGFTGSLCWIYKNPKPGTETQNTGEGGPAVGQLRGALLITPEMTSASSLCCPLSLPTKGGTRAGRDLPGTVWLGQFGLN